MLYRAFDMTITDQTTNEVMRLFRPLTCQVRSFIIPHTAVVLCTQKILFDTIEAVVKVVSTWLIGVIVSEEIFFHEIRVEKIVLHDIAIDNLSAGLKISFPGLLLFCSLSTLHTGNWYFEESNFFSEIQWSLCISCIYSWYINTDSVLGINGSSVCAQPSFRWLHFSTVLSQNLSDRDF